MYIGIGTLLVIIIILLLIFLLWAGRLWLAPPSSRWGASGPSTG